MSWFARAVYGVLVWRERRNARRKRRRGLGGEKVEPGNLARRPEAIHLKTGRRGEALAYWYLRQAGYMMIARNRRPGARQGELDLVGWDGPVLAFVEVKTRTSAETGSPEMAVSAEQRRRIVKAAQGHLRGIPRRDVTYRFDIASVFWDAEAGFCVRLVKDAFRDR